MSATPVMIVDDSPVNVKLLQVLLTGVGYDVWTAQDAEEALEILQTRSPRLILMDLQLPGMDGLELTRRLKADQNTTNILIIAISANAMKADADAARVAGCDGFISKPIDTRSLPTVLAGYLARDVLGEGTVSDTPFNPGR